jgi:uncharacterized lipoprotein YajG
MRRLACVLAGVALTAGCGTSAQAPKVAERTPAPSPSSTTVAQPVVPELSKKQRAAYLAELEKIDPRLVKHQKRAIDRGRDVCVEILQHLPEKEVAKSAQMRFTSKKLTLSDQQAGRVVHAVGTWCQA